MGLDTRGPESSRHSGVRRYSDMDSHRRDEALDYHVALVPALNHLVPRLQPVRRQAHRVDESASASRSEARPALAHGQLADLAPPDVQAGSKGKPVAWRRRRAPARAATRTGSGAAGRRSRSRRRAQACGRRASRWRPRRRRSAWYGLRRCGSPVGRARRPCRRGSASRPPSPRKSSRCGGTAPGPASGHRGVAGRAATGHGERLSPRTYAAK
jgi:hypothetical protein